MVRKSYGSRRWARLEPECEATTNLHGNTDPGFTPGSTPGFGPGSGSNSIVIDSNQSAEPPDFTRLKSLSVSLDHHWSQSRRTHCKTAMQRFDPARRLQTVFRACLLPPFNGCVPREAYIVIRVGLARLARKAGLAGRAIVLSSGFSDLRTSAFGLRTLPIEPRTVAHV